MNQLQNIPAWVFGPVFLTLNPVAPPHPLCVQGIWEYSRPLLSNAAINSQKKLCRIQNIRGISYCGSWVGYGLLEDSVRSAFQIAVDHLGAELPFKLVDSALPNRPIPRLTRRESLLRLLLRAILIWLSILGIATPALFYFRRLLGLKRIQPAAQPQRDTESKAR